MSGEENAVYTFDCTHDLRMDKDFQKGFQLTRPFNLIFSCFVILFTLWNINNIILFGGFFSQIQWFMSISFLIISLIVWIRDRNGSINYKRILASNAGKPARHVIEFTDSVIEHSEPDTGNHGQITYDRIRKIVRTKENLILFMNYSQGFCVPRSALSGDEEPFLSFFERKMWQLEKKESTFRSVRPYTEYPEDNCTCAGSPDHHCPACVRFIRSTYIRPEE